MQKRRSNARHCHIGCRLALATRARNSPFYWGVLYCAPRSETHFRTWYASVEIVFACRSWNIAYFNGARRSTGRCRITFQQCLECISWASTFSKNFTRAVFRYSLADSSSVTFGFKYLSRYNWKMKRVLVKRGTNAALMKSLSETKENYMCCGQWWRWKLNDALWDAHFQR